MRVKILAKVLSRASEKTGRERRRYPRFEASEPTGVFSADGGEALGSGLIRDISGGGACLAVERELSIGLRVRFQCSVGDVTAIIRRCSACPNGYLIGVEFSAPVSLDADFERTLPAAW